VTNYVISYVTSFGLLYFHNGVPTGEIRKIDNGCINRRLSAKSACAMWVTNTQIHPHYVFLPYRISDSSAQKFSKIV